MDISPYEHFSCVPFRSIRTNVEWTVLARANERHAAAARDDARR